MTPTMGAILTTAVMLFLASLRVFDTDRCCARRITVVSQHTSRTKEGIAGDRHTHTQRCMHAIARLKYAHERRHLLMRDR
eukprot:1718805-Rhodomonas_salina.1